MFDDREFRRNEARGQFNNDWLQARLSFAFGALQPSHRLHFGVLRVISEDVIAPGRGFEMHLPENLGTLMLPVPGRIARIEILGNLDAVRPNEVLLVSAGTSIQHSQKNPDSTAPEQHLQVWLFPRHRALRPRVEERRFAINGLAGQRGRWQRIASGDGSQYSLRIDPDASLFRARVSTQRLRWWAAPAHSVRLHVVHDRLVSTGSSRHAQLPQQAGDAVALPQAASLQLAAHVSDPEMVQVDLSQPL